MTSYTRFYTRWIFPRNSHGWITPLAPQTSGWCSGQEKVAAEMTNTAQSHSQHPREQRNSPLQEFTKDGNLLNENTQFPIHYFANYGALGILREPFNLFFKIPFKPNYVIFGLCCDSNLLIKPVTNCFPLTPMGCQKWNTGNAEIWITELEGSWNAVPNFQVGIKSILYWWTELSLAYWGHCEIPNSKGAFVTLGKVRETLLNIQITTKDTKNNFRNSEILKFNNTFFKILLPILILH